MCPYSYLGVGLNKQQLAKIYRTIFPFVTKEDIEWLRKTGWVDWQELRSFEDARLPDGDLLSPSGGWLIKLTEWQIRWLATTTELSFRIQEVVDAKFRGTPRWGWGDTPNRTILDYRVANGLPVTTLHEIAKLLSIKVEGPEAKGYVYPPNGEMMHKKADYIKAIMAHIGVQ